MQQQLLQSLFSASFRRRAEVIDFSAQKKPSNQGFFGKREEEGIDFTCFAHNPGRMILLCVLKER